MRNAVVADVLNAAKLIFSSTAFLDAEERNTEAANAPRKGASIAERAALVRRAFWRSATLVLLAFVVGGLIAAAMRWVGYALYPRWQLFLQAMSAAILLWDTVFVRGWDIQSYGGAMLTERANRTLYLILYVSGTTLDVFATLSPTLSHN